MRKCCYVLGAENIEFSISHQDKFSTVPITKGNLNLPIEFTSVAAKVKTHI